MQFTDEKGKKWCYAGYAKPKIGEYIVGETGIIVAATIHEAYTWLIVRPILPPVLPFPASTQARCALCGRKTVLYC